MANPCTCEPGADALAAGRSRLPAVLLSDSQKDGYGFFGSAGLAAGGVCVAGAVAGAALCG